MLMVYPRTTPLRRKFSRYLVQLPDLFTGKLEGIYLMKNSGASMALILAEWKKAKGNVDVWVCEPLRIDDFLEDSDLKEIVLWQETQGIEILKDETQELPQEKAQLLAQVLKKRFSVQLNLH